MLVLLKPSHNFENQKSFSAAIQQDLFLIFIQFSKPNIDSRF